jgi:predicted O-linked N-acetylglucosamine transferase (SPINDLY family)
LESDPRNVAILTNYGIVLHLLEDNTGAIEQYNRALQVQPGFGPAHANLGLVLIATGSKEAGARELSTAVTLNPLSAAIPLFNLGRLAADEPGRRDEAVVLLQRSLLLQPYLAQAHNLLGVLVEEENPKRAIDAYTTATTIDPSYLEAIFNLADLDRRRGKVVQSAAEYQHSLELALASSPAALDMSDISLGDIVCPLAYIQTFNWDPSGVDRTMALMVQLSAQAHQQPQQPRPGRKHSLRGCSPFWLLALPLPPATRRSLLHGYLDGYVATHWPTRDWPTRVDGQDGRAAEAAGAVGAEEANGATNGMEWEIGKLGIEYGVEYNGRESGAEKGAEQGTERGVQASKRASKRASKSFSVSFMSSDLDNRRHPVTSVLRGVLHRYGFRPDDEHDCDAEPKDGAEAALDDDSEIISNAQGWRRVGWEVLIYLLSDGGHGSINPRPHDRACAHAGLSSATVRRIGTRATTSAAAAAQILGAGRANVLVDLNGYTQGHRLDALLHLYQNHQRRPTVGHPLRLMYMGYLGHPIEHCWRHPRYLQHGGVGGKGGGGSSGDGDRGEGMTGDRACSMPIHEMTLTDPWSSPPDLLFAGRRYGSQRTVRGRGGSTLALLPLGLSLFPPIASAHAQQLPRQQAWASLAEGPLKDPDVLPSHPPLHADTLLIGCPFSAYKALHEYDPSASYPRTHAAFRTATNSSGLPLPSLVRVWASILRREPFAVLLLLQPGQASSTADPAEAEEGRDGTYAPSGRAVDNTAVGLWREAVWSLFHSMGIEGRRRVRFLRPAHRQGHLNRMANGVLAHVRTGTGLGSGAGMRVFHVVQRVPVHVVLDTPGYNGGASALDALWAGLPIVTLPLMHTVSKRDDADRCPNDGCGDGIPIVSRMGAAIVRAAATGICGRGRVACGAGAELGIVHARKEYEGVVLRLLTRGTHSSTGTHSGQIGGAPLAHALRACLLHADDRKGESASAEQWAGAFERLLQASWEANRGREQGRRSSDIRYHVFSEQP